MPFFSQLPVEFISLALAHFVALLTPGQDFLLLSAYALRYRLRGSVFICVGIALGNAIYIALAIFGWQLLQTAALAVTVLSIASSIFLIWLGWRLSRASQGVVTSRTADQVSPSVFKQLGLGLGSALLNPKNGLFYFSLMSVILSPHTSQGQLVAMGVWMTMIVLCWDLWVVTVIAAERVQRRLQRWSVRLEQVAGMLLLLLGVALLLRALWQLWSA